MTGVVTVEPAFVREQIETTVADIPPDAVKTGMLANAAIVDVVAGAIDDHGWPTVVVDPVMVATTGATLLDPDAVAAVRERLLPRATLVTPNAPEAAALLESRVDRPDDQARAARALVERLGARAVLVKGGDLEGEEIVDVYYDGDRLEVYREPRIVTTSTHGSGCALASSIAARLARGEPLFDAVGGARAWIRRAIEGAPELGGGRGPLDLFRSR